MANPKPNLNNLKTVRTTEEAKKLGSTGGKKSGEARRRKRDMKAQMKMLLELSVAERNKKNMAALGIDADDMDNMTLMLVGQLQEAIKGNTNAAKFVATMSGNIPMTEHERQRIAIEKEKLALEKARIEAFKEKGMQIAPGGMPIMIVDDVPEGEEDE